MPLCDPVNMTLPPGRLRPAGIIKRGNNGDVSCSTFCTSTRYPGGAYPSCEAAFDTAAQRYIGCNRVRGYNIREVTCYCQGPAISPSG